MPIAQVKFSHGSELDGEHILQENLRVHAAESHIYDAAHKEIFNSFEQLELERDLDLLCELTPVEAVDLGAGTGNVALKLLDRGVDVTAVDLSLPMLDLLRQKAEGRHGSCRTICVDADTFLSGVEGLPQLVTMSSFLHHLPSPWETLSEIGRLVPPGGDLLITHEPTGRPQSVGPSILSLLDRLLWNIRHPRLAGAGRRIDYRVSDYHARAGFEPDRVKAALEAEGLVVHRTRVYATARLAWLARLSTALGGDSTFTMIASRPAESG